jgi:hypothetical protein
MEMPSYTIEEVYKNATRYNIHTAGQMLFRIGVEL